MAGSEAPGSRVEHVTATGIRFIGPKAASLASRSESAVAPGRDEDTLFVARCQVRRRLGTGSALNIVLQELSAAVLEGWPGAPPLTRDRSVRRPAARFEGLVWDVDGDAGAWRGELLWRRPHPVIAGAPCTTHVILSELDANVTLLVRVTADKGLASVRGMVGAGQARPIFLSAMSRTLRMFHDGLEAAAHPLPDDAIAGFVRDVLLSDTREHPVALLAPQEDGAFVVPPPEIAADLIGIAHVYFMERHAATFRLSDELGDRRLSAYWGALRVYLPGFSCGDRPEEHPLLVRDRLVDPVMRADLYGSLGRFARRRIAWPERTAPAEAPVTPGPTAPRAEVAETTAPAPERSAVQATPAPVQWPPELLDLGPRLEALTAAIADLIASNQSLANEFSLLRTTTAIRAGNAASLERRLGGLERAIERLARVPAGDGPALDAEAPAGLEDGGDEPPDADAPSLVEVVRLAAAAHPDTLLFLESAERSAADSPFEDPEKVAVILDAMAEIARRRQEGAIGTSLREAFRGLGIDYRGGVSATTPRRYLEQYETVASDGTRYQCEEHIAVGGTYDPRRCLRIYFTTRAPQEPRFVIGWVGRHFRVKTTS